MLSLSKQLHLLHDNGYLEESAFNSLHHDLERIIKGLTSIVGTTSKGTTSKGIKQKKSK